MKFLIIAYLLCFFTFVCPAMAQEMTLPRLQVNGNHLETKEGKPITLRGVSLCSPEWHKPLLQIQQVTHPVLGWDANVLRLPVQVKEWDRVGAEGYIKTYLDPAIKVCTRKNMYCIIDWHEIGAWDDPVITAKLEDFWKRVAPIYADNPNILYEIFNEPTTPVKRTLENWLAWRDAAQKWVDDIRTMAPETVLLIGSPHWSQMPAFAAKEPFKGENLVYVMHLYPNWKRAHWDDLFGDAAKDIPLFLSEGGWSSQESSKKLIYAGDEESFGNPLKTYLAERPHVSWTAWSYDPKCGPAMLGADKDMGRFVKEWLAEAQGSLPQ